MKRLALRLNPSVLIPLQLGKLWVLHFTICVHILIHKTFTFNLAQAHFHPKPLSENWEIFSLSYTWTEQKSELVQVNSILCSRVSFVYVKKPVVSYTSLFGRKKKCLIFPPFPHIKLLSSYEICCLGDHCWGINTSSSFVMHHSYAGTSFLYKMLCQPKGIQSIWDVIVWMISCDKSIYILLYICII